MKHPRSKEHSIVDNEFQAVRAKLIDVAAFIDRIERHNQANDYRADSLKKAIALLPNLSSDRAENILKHFSDPTNDPIDITDGKAASGAFEG